MLSLKPGSRAYCVVVKHTGDSQFSTLNESQSSLSHIPARQFFIIENAQGNYSLTKIEKSPYRYIMIVLYEISLKELSQIRKSTCK